MVDPHAKLIILKTLRAQQYDLDNQYIGIITLCMSYSQPINLPLNVVIS